MSQAKRRAKAQVAMPAKPRRKALVRRRRVSLIVRAFQALLCFAAVGGICYALTDYVTSSARFKVKSLQIVGTEVLSPDTIRAAAGITTDDNLLVLEMEAARQRVEALPYVRSCEMKRAYPDSIIIEVVERAACATVLVNHRGYEIDADAVVLREIDPLAPHTGPLITEIGGIDFVQIGQRLDVVPLNEALAVWEAFSATSLGKEWTLSEIAAAEPGSVLMYCDELPFEIRWGRQEIARQAQLLEIWWRAKQGENPCSQYIDLRFGADSLVCK